MEKSVIDKECCDILAEKFCNTAGVALGRGNTYDQTILNPRFEMLAEKVKDTYPEYYQSFVNVRTMFVQKIHERFNDKKVDKNSAEAAVQSR